jgi:two-component system C4-dicarboxylate transport response regulator DctD
MSCVLIVDGDARVREAVARWLTAAGYDTQEAADAETAVERLAAGVCAVVLCDVTMRGGLGLVERARQQYPTVAMVLATGVDDVSPSAILAGNVVDCLVKPFEQAAVLSAVDRARAWHEAAVQRKDSGDETLVNWLRGGRSQSPEIK